MVDFEGTVALGECARDLDVSLKVSRVSTTCIAMHARCAGAEGALDHSFGSSCHGAGRVLSRSKAIKMAKGRAIQRELEDKGIFVQSRGKRTLKEEMPEAYKDVSQVVDAVHEAGLAKKVARLRPLGVIKG